MVLHARQGKWEVWGGTSMTRGFDWPSPSCTLGQSAYTRSVADAWRWTYLSKSVEHGCPSQVLVDISENARCTCYELQEMIWLCQHVISWDDKDGHDFMRHFQPCWLTSSIVALYAPRMPFLLNDLEGTIDYFPLEIAVWKGCHCVVRMERGTKSG